MKHSVNKPMGLWALTLAASLTFSSANAVAAIGNARPQLADRNAPAATVPAYLRGWNPTRGIGDFRRFVAKFTVALDGSGTHKTIQSAISAAALVKGGNRVYIAVKPGIYSEVVCVPPEAPPITLYGIHKDPNKTLITYNNANPKPKIIGRAANPCSANLQASIYGTSGSATFWAASRDFQATNLSFINSYVEGQYPGNNQAAIALAASGDLQIYENVRIYGNQDTLLSKSNTPAPFTARQYFKNAVIKGDTDFVFGNGTAVFDMCEIRYLADQKSNGVIFAPSTAPSEKNGFLVIRSRLTVSGPLTAAAKGRVSLGRAYDQGIGSLANYVNGVSPNGQITIRDSNIAGHISAATPWTSSTAYRPYCSANCAYSANRFYEYKNGGLGSGF